MERLGRGLVGVVGEFYETMAFNGHLLSVVGKAIIRPHKVRWASVATVAERSGIDAIPIVAITTFFIGAVIGLLGVNMLAEFGAQISPSN